MSVELRLPRGTDYTVRYIDPPERVPSEGQYRLLRIIANGAALTHASKRECEPLIRHEWVTYLAADERGYGYVRITPEGIRAYARAVEKFGLPEIPKLVAA